jgi:hypothetical protein
MRSIAYTLPALPGFTPPKTYAAWPVWRDSTTRPVKFHPLTKKEAAKWWHQARRFDRQTHTRGKHGGAIGRTALDVLYVLALDILNHATGELDPSYDKIAKKAGVCRRTVATALRRLRDFGLLHWQRRSREEPDAAGGYRQVQETNAYALLPPSHWRGYREPSPAPPPEPGTWGDHPPLPNQHTVALDELTRGQHRAAMAALECDDPDGPGAVLARWGRRLFDLQS